MREQIVERPAGGEIDGALELQRDDQPIGGDAGVPQAQRPVIHVRTRMNRCLQPSPVEVADGDPLHGRLRTRLFDLHQQHVARVVLLPAVGLGRAGVPGAGRDLPCSVPIAERQIIQPCPVGSIVGDGVLRLRFLRQPVGDAAVGETDAHGGRRRFRRVEPFGQVDGLLLAPQGRRQNYQTAIRQHDRLRRGGEQQVAGNTPAHNPRPDAFGERSVVVAGQQHPGSRKSFHRALSPGESSRP